jgi:hypothetical protein
MEPIVDLPEEEKVIIVDEDGNALALSKEYLICWF